MGNHPLVWQQQTLLLYTLKSTMNAIIGLLLLGISITSGNRLLLQQYVAITPAPVTPSPPIVEPVDPTVLPPPPNVVIPAPPAVVDPAAVTTVTPVVTTAPVVTAPRVTPSPTYPRAPGMLMKKLDCKLSPPNFGSCAGTTQNIYDPTLDFELLCSAQSACLGSTINFHFGPYHNPYMEELKGLWFKAELAAADATINFYHQPNYQGNKLRIAEINCDKLNSCFNTQFILGPYMELEVGDFFCGPGACTGCMIKESATDPGVPCYYYTEPI